VAHPFLRGISEVARGGPTDLTNAISLCSFHHHRCHDDSYLHEYLPNGDVRYRRRT
jgi:hypothetical protein